MFTPVTKMRINLIIARIYAYFGERLHTIISPSCYYHYYGKEKENMDEINSVSLCGVWCVFFFRLLCDKVRWTRSAIISAVIYVFFLFIFVFSTFDSTSESTQRFPLIAITNNTPPNRVVIRTRTLRSIATDTIININTCAIWPSQNRSGKNIFRIK